MEYTTITAITIVVVLAIIYFCSDDFIFGAWNTRTVSISTNESYKVHNAHADTKAAAKLLGDINSRNETLIQHLQSKYAAKDGGGTATAMAPDPYKNNRIDILPTSSLYEDMASSDMREYMQERINQLVSNYSSDRLYEISPLNTGDATSYTEDKRTLILCLRQKKPTPTGEHPLHDVNTMMFVVLHELAHMMNNLWQHKTDFWILFKFMLQNAVEAGVYTPVDYARYPINYCGLDLTYNPYFDVSIQSVI